MELMNRTFTMSELTAITGAKAETIKNWRRAHLIVGSGGDVEGRGTGNHISYSFNSLVEIAIMLRLTGLGLSVGRASEVARDFAHTSGFSPKDHPQRQPGFPFHHEHGDTLFAIGARFTANMVDAPDVYQRLSDATKSRDMTILNMSEVFNEVCGSLNIHPYKVLDEVYSQDVGQ